MADARDGVKRAPEDLVGERIAGRFMLERLIGRGELSSAFRAHDERLHRRVTVKLFHPRHRDDVGVVDAQLAAARAVARLSHEHIAMVIDRSEHEGMPLIVQEHVRGENLDERIERFAPLAVGEVVTYSLQIARALAYAHGQGVMHGNLRPGNVLLTEERSVKLVDFGGGSYVAQLVGDPYAAPELREVDSDAPPEPSDDIYALGALVFVALTEHAPVPDVDAAELQLLRPDISPRLARTVARALSSDPSGRHGSMREVAAEFSSVRESMASGSSAALTGRHAAAPAALGADSTQAFSIGDLHDATGEGSAVSDTHVLRRPAGRRVRRARARTPRESRARILAWSIVVLPLAAVALFGTMIAGERGSDQVNRAQVVTDDGPVELISVASATTFDPPPGDGVEHEDTVANAIDGDSETSWQTEGYAQESFSGGKVGVGIVLDLGSPRDVRDVAFLTDLPNWTVQVRAAAEPATTLDGWEVASKAASVNGGERIPVDLPDGSTRYILLWITKLALDTEDANKARARIDDIRVFAASGAR